MNKKLKNILQPNMRFYFIMLIVFAVCTFFFGDKNIQLAIAEAVVILLLFFYARRTERRRSREMLHYIESVTSNIDSAAKNSLQNFPLPMVSFGLENDTITYANESFLTITGDREHLFEVKISDAVPGFSARWLMEGKNEHPGLVTLGDRRYRVFGSLARGSNTPGVNSYVATTYWVDETEYAEISDEFKNSRVVFAIILLDNYDEYLNGLAPKERTAVLQEIDNQINEWAAGCGGYLSNIDRDRYLFLFEERYLPDYIAKRFSVLDDVRALSNPKGMHPTLSIGVGRDGHTFQENQQFASIAIEMALSRGGDQAVIKNRFNFEFYGGKTSQTEKRTKVKSRVMASSFSRLMRDASKILIMGHKYSDLDSVGSAVGLCCAARALEREAHIVLDYESSSARNLVDRMRTLPEYQDTFIDEKTALLMADGNTLLIVVDTNRPEQVESDSLLLSVNRVAFIDHHRRAATYIQNAVLAYHEPYASSASELVTELLEYTVDQADILRFEAEALLSGIVLDTKSFTLRTGGRTFDAAGFLRRAGADTSEVKELLQSDIGTAMARYAIIQRAKVYKAGIAIAAPEGLQNRIVAAQAADELLNISGIQASFVVFNSKESVDISARSIGDINVQLIVEKLGGGGNKSTAGAQLKDKSQKEVVHDLLLAIDGYIEDNT